MARHATLRHGRCVTLARISGRRNEPGRGVLRSLLPLIERAGIATAAEIDIDTLAVRMHADAVAHERVMFLPRVVGAWTAVPSTRPG